MQVFSTVLESLHKKQIIGPLPADHSAFGYIGGAGNPARQVALRMIDPHHFSIVNAATGEEIEQIEQCKAFWEVYDGAIYMFQGRPVLCRKLDLVSRVAEVVPCHAKYYTTTIDALDIQVTGGQLAYVQVWHEPST
jgi:DEAD/DEAH box helicase domain-containing protein